MGGYNEAVEGLGQERSVGLDRLAGKLVEDLIKAGSRCPSSPLR